MSSNLKIRKIAIVGCLHGDEVIGKKVIDELKKIKLKNGSLNFFIGNPPAVKKCIRWIDKDLNRSFPGTKDAKHEEGIAYKLNKVLKPYDLVIDIHATSSSFDKLAIVTKWDQKTKELLRLVPIEKVAFIDKKVFGGKEMITHTKMGLAIEFGPNKSGKNYKKALKALKTLLINLEFIGGKKEFFGKKNVFIVSGIYEIGTKFKQNPKLKDFEQIKKGQLIGWEGKKELVSKKDFYPLFLGKGRYKENSALALMASKKELTL